MLLDELDDGEPLVAEQPTQQPLLLGVVGHLMMLHLAVDEPHADRTPTLLLAQDRAHGPSAQRAISQVVGTTPSSTHGRARWFPRSSGLTVGTRVVGHHGDRPDSTLGDPLTVRTTPGR